jgi:transposase
MAAKRYVVTLTAEERAHLLALTKKRKVAARRLTRAHILLQADVRATQEAIAAALHIGRATVVRICRRFIEEALEAALRDRSRPGAQRKLDGKQEAFLIALAGSPPPEGRTCWTMQLLANQLDVARLLTALGIIAGGWLTEPFQIGRERYVFRPIATGEWLSRRRRRLQGLPVIQSTDGVSDDRADDAAAAHDRRHA